MWSTNGAQLQASLKHHTGRGQQLSFAPGTLVIDSAGLVTSFILPVSGHLDAVMAGDEGSPWKHRTMTLPSGERLVYLVADTRNPNGIGQSALTAFAHAIASTGLGLLADRADPPQHRSGFAALAESYNRNQAMRPLVDWFDEHLASGLQRVRSTGPDGYINAFNRQPAWKGTIRCDASARPIRLD